MECPGPCAKALLYQSIKGLAAIISSLGHLNLGSWLPTSYELSSNPMAAPGHYQPIDRFCSL